MNAELESKASFFGSDYFSSLGFSTTSTFNTINLIFFLICGWDFVLIISREKNRTSQKLALLLTL